MVATPLQWHSTTAKSDGVNDCFMECFQNLGLSQFVCEPTRFTSNGIGNILDIILCNDNLSVNINSIDEPFSTSDHCLINFNLYSTVIDRSDRVDIVHNSSPSNEHSILLPVYNWADGDYAAVNESLKSLDWQSLLGNIFDVDLIWSSFTSVVRPIIALYVPKRLVSHSTKYRVKKYPSSIRTLLSRKAALWRKLKSDFSDELKNRYTYVSMICKQAILDFDVEIENRILKANNLGAFYRFVNNKLRSRGGIAPPPLYDSAGTLLVSDSDKADLLNTFFKSVFTQDDGGSS